MNVFILTQEPFPYGMAATNRITNYAKGLICNGINCTVIITRRTEPYGRLYNTNTIGFADNIVPFKYIPPTTQRSSNFFTRRVHDFTDDIAVYQWLNKNVNSDDVIIYFNSRYWGSKRIIKTCHKKGIKIVRELCEFPFCTRTDSLKNKILLKRYENYIMPHFDGFIAISEKLNKYAQEISSPYAKIIKIPILIDVKLHESIQPYFHHRRYIFHAGTMYERKDAIVSTMKAFAEANKVLNGEVDFILAGPKSPHQEELDKIILDNRLQDNVHFIGKISHKKVIGYQKGAWLTILNKHDNIQNRNGFSTKLGDILLAGTPVITTKVGEANNYLQDGVSALIAQSSDANDISHQIIRAFLSPELLTQISKCSQQIARKNFDYHIQGERMKRFLVELSNES